MEAFEVAHVKKNLDKLIRYTDVSATFLSYLMSSGVISNEEYDDLNAKRHAGQSAVLLYKIMQTRRRAYPALTHALVATNQSAACSILLKLKPVAVAQSYQVNFQSKPIGLQDFMESAGDERIMVIYTSDSTVTSTKIKDTSGLKINIISDTEYNSEPLIPSKNIVCIKLERLSRLPDFATQFSCNDLPRDKKIIIITEQEPAKVFRCSQNCIQTSKCKIKISVDEFKWTDLTDVYQQELLHQNISDQGRIKTLHSFCRQMVYEESEDFLIRFLNGELLLDLINNKLPVIYRQLVPAVTFYVKRKLKRQSRLNSKLFDSDSQLPRTEVFVFSGYEKYELAHFLKRDFISSTKVISDQKNVQFIRLKADEDFELVCSLAHHDANVHYFRQTKFKGRYEHIWIKSKGNIASILKFIEEGPDCFYEEEFLQQLDEVQDTFATSPFICICDTPGMGKSILLANLARSIMKTHPNRCVLFIVLTEFMELIQELRFKKKVQEFDVGTLLEALSLIVSSNEFGKQYFRGNSNQKVEIFCDGLDEVPQEKIKVTMMYLKLIPSALKATRIFITARPHLRPLLEEELNTFGYTMKPFDCEDQKKFLTDVWSHTRMVEKQRINKEGLHLLAEICIKKLKSTLGTKEWDIAGIPLQCLLVAEVYREKGYFYADPENKITNKKCENEVNIKSITELYQRLFDKKIDKFERVHLQDKLELKHKTDILKLHGCQSLALIFPSWSRKLKQHLLTEQLHKNLDSICLRSDISLQDFLQGRLPVNDLLVMGFMETLGQDGTPQFIHRTFAEFFSAVLIIKMLKNKDTIPIINFLQDTVLEAVKADDLVGKSVKFKCDLFSFKHNVVCYFINSLLLEPANSNTNIRIHPSPFMLYACTHDDFQQIFTYLLGEKPLIPEFNCEQLLLAAVSYSSIGFLRLVLPHCHPDTLCAKQMLYLAVERGDFSILNLVYGHDVTQKLLSADSELPLQLMETCVSNTQSNASHVIKSKLEILELLQRSSTDPCSSMADMDNLLLCSYVHHQLLTQLLKSCKDLFSADKQLKTVLHKAAEYLTPSQYKSLLLQIPSEKLPTLLKCQDVYRMTPLHCLVLYMQPDPLKESKETVEIFLKNKADFDAEDEFGYSVLRRAISSGRSNEFVELLIKLGANAYSGDKFGRNALHIAAMNWNKSLLQWLVQDKKLNLNSKDEDGNTPLYYCLYNETDESAYNSIQQFVNLGADVNIVNHKEASPLHFAARQGHPQAFKFLLQQGNNLLAIDKQGNNVLHYALRRGSAEDVKRILKDVNLSQFVDLKNDKDETALLSFLKQTRPINLKILEYLANRWGKWRSEEISRAMKVVQLRRSVFETEEEYMQLIMIISEK